MTTLGPACLDYCSSSSYSYYVEPFVKEGAKLGALAGLGFTLATFQSLMQQQCSQYTFKTFDAFTKEQIETLFSINGANSAGKHNETLIYRTVCNTLAAAAIGALAGLGVGTAYALVMKTISPITSYFSYCTCLKIEL